MIFYNSNIFYHCKSSVFGLILVSCVVPDSIFILHGQISQYLCSKCFIILTYSNFISYLSTFFSGFIENICFYF